MFLDEIGDHVFLFRVKVIPDVSDLGRVIRV
jgi:hypothetical protein